MAAEDLAWVRTVICDADYKLLDEKAKSLAKGLTEKKGSGDGATKTQMRILFSTVKRLENARGEDRAKQLAMLRPRLAYAASRAKGLDHLQKVLTKASEEAQREPEKRTPMLVDLMEAIFCYFRATA